MKYPTNHSGKSVSPDGTIHAAMYLRMSTEHQEYSTKNQEDVIRWYADQHNMQIVRIYTDAGKSGLRLEGREAIQQLLSDVESGQADFSVILVYDISRWGRFQDPDESAAIEIRCKQMGISVVYCAEQFQNDGSPMSSMYKSFKRSMAGEYSRELSTKVFIGQTRLIGLGFRQGGPAGFGLRRQLVDHARSPKEILPRKVHKSIQTDRVILVPGPEEEVRVVNEIYRAFVEDGRSEREIASMLNERGILTDMERLWTRGTVHQILINEKYIGANVWNKRSYKLKKERVRNVPEQWVRAENVFEAIVDKALFEAAQEIIHARSRRLSDDEMLEALRSLLEQKGYLSAIIIDEYEDGPSSSAYQSRFGGLLRCYALIGYDSGRDVRYIEINRKLRQRYPELVAEILSSIHKLGGEITVDPDTDLLTINQEFSAALVLCRCRETPAGSLRWQIRLDMGLFPNITIAARMSPDNEQIQDYYLLPSLDMRSGRLNVAQENHAGLDIYRYDTLDALFSLAKRTTVEEVRHDMLRRRH